MDYFLEKRDNYIIIKEVVFLNIRMLLQRDAVVLISKIDNQRRAANSHFLFVNLPRILSRIRNYLLPSFRSHNAQILQQGQVDTFFRLRHLLIISYN